MQYQKGLKDSIKKLINLGILLEASELIKQYQEIVAEDIEIYSMKAVIAILESRFADAETILQQGLNVDNVNPDLLYNLAYVYETQEKYQEAYSLFLKLSGYDNLGEYRDLVFEAIQRLRKFAVVETYKVGPKKKIVFFVKQGMDSFLGDIINVLSNDYKIKKVIVTQMSQIDQEMQWADICWFEWCDELVEYGSKQQLSKEKKIICRIHGYEVYGDLIVKPYWNNVDDLIIVAPHIRRMFEEGTKSLKKGNLRVHTVFCGINVERYPLNIKNKGYNLGYLGYINHKKNIPLTLDIFKKLHSIDNRYKLFLAGQFQDSRILAYLKYFTKEYNLYDSIFFDGWQDDKSKVKWFRKIDYMIISSIDEGLCFAAAEAMCSGIKPILHNCEGIKDHYDKNYIFDTLDEAVDMINSSEYNSESYRQFIFETYNFQNEISKIEEIMSIPKKTRDLKTNDEFDYKKYWDDRYNRGGTSGDGSYGILADFKAGVINKYLKDNNINSVIEFGCGDGNQLGLIDYKDYLGVDISSEAVKRCRKKYRGEKNKKFSIYKPGAKSLKNLSCDLVVCLDVLYHIIDENDFINTLNDIFTISAKHIIVYTILEKPKIQLSEHLIFRDIEEYKQIYKEYDIKEIIKQKYKEESMADFVIFEKKDTHTLETPMPLVQYSVNNKSNTVEKETVQSANTFDYVTYWNNRLNPKFDIEGVGYIGLGKIYNKYMYQIRFDILNYIVGSFFPKGLRKKQVLELGPGIGLFTDYFYKQKASYKAIDIAERSVKELKGRYKNYTFTQGDLSNPALFQSNEYDLVFAADVLLHLTDEEKYKIAINNIARSLKETGYAILFDPITVVNASSPSPHVVIRNIEYIKKVCTENGLEVVEILPCSFFMNFPFDREIFPDGDKIENVFSMIQRYFGSENSEKDKEIVAQCLSVFEKLCLIKFQLSLSQKVVILKKTSNKYEAKLSINKVWDVKSVSKEFSIAKKKFSGLLQNPDLAGLDKLLYEFITTDLELAQDSAVIKLDYLQQNNENFIPFDSKYVDNYDFMCGYKILIGRKEKVTSNLEMIEFIVENSAKRKLLFLNIWYDLTKEQVTLPSYLLNSSNSSLISEAIVTVLDINVDYVNNIGGFIFDEDIKRDIAKNSLAYNWERGIPATQFLHARALLTVIERYKFAGAQLKFGDIILDAASGFGYGAAYMSRFCDKVYALDIAQDNIDFAKSSYQLPNVIWQNGDVTQLPYDDHYFDAYISFETMEHLPLDIVELYFTEAVRVLKKGGKMIISTPNRDMRMHVNNPFHIKEYSFPEFDTILRKYFSIAEYFSVVNYKVLQGFKENAFDMLAVCIK